jgi:hypothetical protein
VRVFLNHGDGTFAAGVDYAAGVAPDPIAAADVNGDGKPDLLVAYGTTVSVLMNHGDGTFAAHADYDTGYDNEAWGFVVADLNGDGAPDIAVSSYFLAVLVNQGNGTFVLQSPFEYDGSYHPGIAAADLNGDGKVDLVYDDGTVLYNHGDATFDVVSYGGGGGAVGVADMNGDGLPDIVTTTGGAACILQNRGGKMFSAPACYAVWGGPLAIADLNGDGQPDVAVSSSSTNTVRLMFQTCLP